MLASVEGAATYDRRSAAHHFALFDGLRAIAVLIVVVGHVAAGTGHTGLVQYRGNVGVAIFFAISGFLLYRPFVARRVSGRSVNLANYGMRRFLRIVPAYWLALTALAIKPGLTGVFTEDFWAYYGFAQTYGFTEPNTGLLPAWSLCVEVTFYLFLPFYAWVIARTSKRDGWVADAIGLTLLTALALWFHYRVQDELDHVQFYYSLLGRFDWFVPGMALAVASVLLHERGKRPRLVRMVERWPSACWIGAGACAYLLCTSVSRFPLNTPTEAIVETVVYALLGFLFILPAVFGEDRGGAPRRLLALPVIAWIGLISYGIYLWHEPIAYWFGARLHDFPEALVATLGLTILCAAVSWYLFEKPIIAWGRRLEGLRAQTRRAHVGS